MTLTKIEHAEWIITMDETRRVISDGTIVVENDTIRYVGKADGAHHFERVDKLIDARGKVVTPGLIDAHTHHSLQFGRGLADECDIQRFLYSRLYPIESSLTEEDAYVSALLCQLELVKSGTTCVIDAGNYFPEATVRAFGTSGLRGVVARSAFDISKSSLGTLPSKVFSETTDQALDHGEAFVHRYNGAHEGRVSTWLQLRVLPNCSDELCHRLTALTERLGIRYEAHASFTKEVYESSKLQFGKSEIQRLHDVGVLGPNLLLAHMGWLTPRDMSLLADSGTHVVLCPTSSFHQGMGSISFGHVPELLEMGVNCCLGTDGGPHGTNDLVRQMFVAAGGYKEVRLDATVMPPETVLEMATRNGAKALGREHDLGAIGLNRKADIAIFDAKRPEWRPLHNPVANLVYSATGTSVDTVLVDGKVLMEGGRVLMFDEQKILSEAQRRSTEVAERAGLLDFGKPAWPVE